MGESSSRPRPRRAPLPRLVAWLTGKAAVGLRRFGAWVSATGGPAARRAGAAGLRATGKGVGAVGRTLLRRRAIVVAIAARVAWCLALWCLVQGLTVLLGLQPLGTDEEILAPFIRGVALVLGVVAVTQERHLRRGAIVLGAAHVVALLLAWTALAAAA